VTVQGRRMQRKECQEMVVQLDHCIDLGRVLAPHHLTRTLLHFNLEIQHVHLQIGHLRGGGEIWTSVISIE
jgi:hypothetical protein